jgi:hypothetical protein
MGTPHQSIERADLQKLALRAAKVNKSTDTGISNHLKRDPGWLRQLDGQYEPIKGEFVTIFANETAPTLGKMIVRYYSACHCKHLTGIYRLYHSLRQSCQAFLMQRRLIYLQTI